MESLIVLSQSSDHPLVRNDNLFHHTDPTVNERFHVDGVDLSILGAWLFWPVKSNPGRCGGQVGVETDNSIDVHVKRNLNTW